MSDENMTPEEVQALRAQLLAEATATASTPAPSPSLKGKAKKVAPARAMSRGVLAAGAGAPVNANSIRQTIIRELLDGTPRKDIAAMLQEKFPGTQAAAKSTVHIAFYVGKLRKAGQLPAYKK